MTGQKQNKEPICDATYIFGEWLLLDFGLFAIIITARSPQSSSSVPARTLFKCKMNCVDSRSLVDMISKMRRKTERHTHTTRVLPLRQSHNLHEFVVWPVDGVLFSLSFAAGNDAVHIFMKNNNSVELTESTDDTIVLWPALERSGSSQFFLFGRETQ